MLTRTALVPVACAGALTAAVLVGGCAGGVEVAALKGEAAEATLEVTSPSFAEGTKIPVRHTCDGEDVSPELAWSQPPAGTASLALIVDDPDAPGGDWVHWVLYDISPDAGDLPEGVAVAEVTPSGASNGVNDFKRLGYGGPCPPSGAPHRYFSKLYALDAEVGLESGATKADLLRRIEGHVLAEGRLMGTYKRR